MHRIVLDVIFNLENVHFVSVELVSMSINFGLLLYFRWIILLAMYLPGGSKKP